MYYAEINEGGICTAVSALKGIVKKETLIEIDSFDISLVGKKYNGCAWEEIPKEETEEAEVAEPTPLSEQEEIALDTALNVEYMVCLMEESLGLE